MNEAKTRSYLPLWILIVVTGLPFLGAWVLYFNPSLMGDMQTSNRGDLVTPPRPVPELTFETLDGSGFQSDELAGHWTLLTVADGTCDEQCETNLYHMRQTRLAMGDQRLRVLRVLLIDGPTTAELGNRLMPYEGTVVLTGPDSARDQLGQLLVEIDGSSALDRLFVIDPQGQLMMAYSPVPKGTDLVKDLERLIQVVVQ